MLSWSFSDTHRAAECLSCPHACSPLRSTRTMVCLFVSALTISNRLLCRLFSTAFFFTFVLFWVILLFKAISNYSAEVLFTVPKSKKVVMCLTEKILDNFRSGTSHSVVAHIFSVNESTLHIK